MFISIRKYHNVRSVEEVRRRVEQEFVPMLKENPGFQGYYLIDCACPESGNIVTSISMFDSWESVLASKIFVVCKSLILQKRGFDHSSSPSAKTPRGDSLSAQ
jgi:hypothetical protein